MLRLSQMLRVPALSPSALTQDTLRRMGLSMITNIEWGRNGSSPVFYPLHTFRSDPPHLVIQSHSTRLRPRSSEGSVPRSTGLWLSQMLRVPALSPSALTQDKLRRMGLSMTIVERVLSESERVKMTWLLSMCSIRKKHRIIRHCLKNEVQILTI